MPNVIRLQPKDVSASDLDEIAREGARRMLAQALEAEVADYIARNQERDENGRAQVVRNGKARPRKVTLGSGTIEVRAPRVDDRRETDDGSRRRFRSQILPPYMRRSPKVAEVLPILYLRGLSTGDFKEGLAALLGDDASGLSPTAITRLTAAWQADYEAFQKRDLSDRDYVYVWADGVHFRIRLEEDRLCALVMIGVRPDGTKELIAIEDGYRESTESWATLLRGLKRRGMRAPVLAVGDGALGFWKALRDVWPETREQRCWVHRIANVLDKLPKRLQAKAKAALHEIMRAETRKAAQQAIDAIRGRLRGQVPEGRGLAPTGRGGAAHLLRLPGRALAAPADGQRDRVALRDGAAAPAGDEGSGLAAEGPAHGLPAPGDGRTPLAADQCTAPGAPRPSGCRVSGRARRRTGSARRLRAEGRSRALSRQ